MQGTEPIKTLRNADTASWVKRRHEMVVLLVNDGKLNLFHFILSFILFSISSEQALKKADSNISSQTLSAISVNTEARKEIVRRAQSVTSKTPKENRHAKNVQSIRTSPKLESRPKRTARHVAQINRQEQQQQTA